MINDIRRLKQKPIIEPLLLAVVLGFILTGPLGCNRSAKRLPDSAFQVAFESHKIASEMKSGETASLEVAIKNISPVTWPSKPDSKDRYAVTLSYHWLGRKGEMVVFDGLRTPLPRDLKPGESADLKASICAPEKPGRYILEVTLVQERSAWFADKGGAKLTLPVTVSEGREQVVAAGANTQRSETVKPRGRPAAAEALVKRDAAIHTTVKTRTPADAASGPWSVQLGSYAEKKVAMKLAKKLQDKGYDAYVTAATIKGKEWHRVRVGRLNGRAEAEKLRETLKTVEKQERAVVASQ